MFLYIRGGKRSQISPLFGHLLKIGTGIKLTFNYFRKGFVIPAESRQAHESVLFSFKLFENQFFFIVQHIIVYQCIFVYSVTCLVTF
jgi:hypothetical protein